ncbi:MAG: secretin N-terminal domain-containing protein [Spartobacteria bacterium]
MLISLPSGAFAQVRPVARPQPLITPTPADDEDDEDDTPDPATAAAPNAPPPAAVTPLPIAAATPARTTAQQNPPSTAPNLVRLQFPNSDVDDVLRLYEQLTGFKLVRDNFVQGKVNIFISKDVLRDEAIKIIEMNLLMNGFSLVPAENGIVKVIGTGKNPRTSGVPIISDQSQIPAGDHVISYLFKLHYADPTELQQVLAQYLSPPQPYTSFLALPKSSTLLITENSSVIRSLVRVIDQIDTPPAEVVSEFIKLERADASKVVDMLKEVFEKGQGQQPGQVVPVPGGIRGVRPAPAAVQQVSVEGDVGALAALSEDSVVVGKIKLTPDVRTNRIHVVTRPINMPFVRKLIAEFDANVEFAKPVTRPLKYIAAGDVLPVLVQALTEPGGNQQAGAEGGLGPANPANQQQQQNRQNRSGGTSNNPNGGGLSSGGSDTGGSLNISEELSTTATDTTPKAVTIGNAKIIADQRANSIIMLGNREVVVKVAKILDEMDVEAPQVAISTVIGELTLSNDEETGVDYFLKYKNKAVGISHNGGAGITIPTSASPASTAVPGIVDSASLINFANLLKAAGSGTNVYFAAGNYLAAAVHLLESTGRFKVISRPMIFTSNNKKAIIASGQEVPVPVSTLSNATTSAGVASVQSSIQFKKVALQLEVVPLINSDKEVSLDILQKIDSVVPNSDKNFGGNSVPTIATRYIRSNVLAPNGCTIVLGGLITDNKGKGYSGIPYLSRIPVVGSLFRSTSKTHGRTELIILMRPEVTITNLDLYRLRVKNENKSHFGAEIDETDCPDCPPRIGDDKQLPAPDLPAPKD